jgi:hypothetical protein
MRRLASTVLGVTVGTVISLWDATFGLAAVKASEREHTPPLTPLSPVEQAIWADIIAHWNAPGFPAGSETSHDHD